MLEAIGGLGLFLLGMIVMTDGLRTLTGYILRKALMRFTHSPLSGAITGATATAILQSSSATTVAAISFVGAGLMSFPAALGIIFGANIGTTFTGWLVAILGFKMKLGTLVLPFILFGVILKLFGNERYARIGYIMAGFGLIFVGINYMQIGMADFQIAFSNNFLFTDSFTNTLYLVAVGIAFTAITQSSSAGVAATLAILYSNLIDFEQAAALVIGINIGTTITAALATIGGSVDSKRAGFSHVVFNLYTSLLAYLIIIPYVLAWQFLSPGAIENHQEVALVAFHSLFNFLGVSITLPFTDRFARLMERLIPDKGIMYTQSLDRTLLKEPAIAISAIQTTIINIFIDMLFYVNRLLGDRYDHKQINIFKMQQAIDETDSYIDEIQLGDEKSTDRQALISIIHCLDHLKRLGKRCTEVNRTNTIQNYSELEDDRRQMITSNTAIIREIENSNWEEVTAHARSSSEQIEEQVQPIRTTIMENVASGKFLILEANDYLEAVRWLDRTSDHIDRICHHLANSNISSEPE